MYERFSVDGLVQCGGGFEMLSICWSLAKSFNEAFIHNIYIYTYIVHVCPIAATAFPYRELLHGRIWFSCSSGHFVRESGEGQQKGSLVYTKYPMSLHIITKLINYQRVWRP